MLALRIIPLLILLPVVFQLLSVILVWKLEKRRSCPSRAEMSRMFYHDDMLHWALFYFISPDSGPRVGIDKHQCHARQQLYSDFATFSLPIGWSWNVYFMYEAVVGQSLVAGASTDTCIRDRHPIPPIHSISRSCPTHRWFLSYQAPLSRTMTLEEPSIAI